MLLLTIGRFFALVTSLHYRRKVTRKRACMATVTCWVYFLLFGFAFSLSQDHFTILAAINNLQMFSILTCIFLTYFLMLYRFHKYSRSSIIHDQHDQSSFTNISSWRKSLQSHRCCYLCISYLFHTLACCTIVNMFLPPMQSKFITTYTCVWTYTRFSVRQFWCESLDIVLHSSTF